MGAWTDFASCSYFPGQGRTYLHSGVCLQAAEVHSGHYEVKAAPVSAEVDMPSGKIK